MTHNELHIGDLKILIESIGAHCHSYGTVYFVGETSLTWLGWRETAPDVELALAPEPEQFYETLAKFKKAHRINARLSRLTSDVPNMPGWQGRSAYITRSGQVDFYHYDFYSEALAKFHRNTPRDMAIIKKMIDARLIEHAQFQKLLALIRPSFIRYPHLDFDSLNLRIIQTFMKVPLEAEDIEGLTECTAEQLHIPVSEVEAVLKIFTDESLICQRQNMVWSLFP
ncbi:MAG: hypothetical protein EOO38_14195, partial [Cytophagaceae bacterium]